jgi:RsiW-degrading membrane proteinase PrsW (M82 family)
MQILLVSLVMGVLPMLCYAAFLWWLDHWEREPFRLIAGAFLWGAVPSTLLAGLLFFGLRATARAATELDDVSFLILAATVWAPVTEELLKGLALLLIYLFVRHELDSLLDGIIYGGMVGFGFGAVENVFYFLGYGEARPELLGGLVLARAFAFGLMHAFFTGLTGLGFALARFRRHPALKILYPALGLALAVLAHSLHNTLLVLPGGAAGFALAFVAQWIGILWLAGVVVISLRRQGRWIRRYLVPEVEAGTLDRAEAEAAASWRVRLFHGFALFGLPRRGRRARRLYALCAKLAFTRRRLEKYGDERGNRRVLEETRRRVREIRRADRPRVR